MFIFSAVIYKQNLNQRFESYAPLMFNVDDFENLSREKYIFIFNKGQKLTSYLYKSNKELGEPHGIIIFAHGFGGGGYNSYMDSAHYFARNGYYVFAYDATGNDETEGRGIGGIPQGLVDLDYAISFVEKSGNFPNLPKTICRFL